MRPVLEEAAVALEQALEHRRPVPLEARGEGQVVGPLDDVDRVDLHEPHPLDQRVEDVGGSLAAWIVEQPLRPEQEPAGGGGGDEGEGGRHLRRIAEEGPD